MLNTIFLSDYFILVFAHEMSNSEINSERKKPNQIKTNKKSTMKHGRFRAVIFYRGSMQINRKFIEK
jgi:hypothetical protein